MCEDAFMHDTAHDATHDAAHGAGSGPVAPAHLTDAFASAYLRCEGALALVPAPSGPPAAYPAAEVALAIRRLRGVRGASRRPSGPPAADTLARFNGEPPRWRWREGSRSIDIGLLSGPDAGVPHANSEHLGEDLGEHLGELGPAARWVASPLLANCEYLDLLRLWAAFAQRFSAARLRDADGRIYTLPEYIDEVALAHLRPALTGDDPADRERADGVQAAYLDLLAHVRPQLPVAGARAQAPFSVLYEDADLLVVDKPSGVVTHPTYKHPDGALTDAVFAREEALGAPRPWLLHRLDKQTSGVTLFARTDAARRDLAAQFALRHVHKRYLALVQWQGALPDAGEIDAPLARDPLDRRRVIVAPDGEPSRTRYRVCGVGAPIMAGESAGQAFALVLAEPVTGRTHQIRAHLAWAGAPLAGDTTYLQHLPERHAARALAPRVMLHAWRLTLRAPRSGEPWSVMAPPPADFLATADALGLGDALRATLSSPGSAPAS